MCKLCESDLNIQSFWDYEDLMQQSLSQPSVFTTTSNFHKRYILVVDDEPSFCTVLSEILRSFGYFVRQAHDAHHAIELLNKKPPDLILTDVMMPGMDGLSFIRQIRSDPTRSAIPTIVISAKAQPEDIRASKEAGADACLVKPFSARELRDVVHKFLTSRH
jgi:two-component system chemotaxis response regulator CheY